FVVIGQQVAAIPVALLHGDLVAELLDELVARRGRLAAELHRRPIRADRIDAGRQLRRVYRGEAIEIRQSLMVVIGVAFAGDGLSGLVTHEFEGPRAENVLFVPMLVL